MITYFIQSKSTGLISIGQTDDLDGTIRTYRAANPILDDTRLLLFVKGPKGPLHVKFAKHRKHEEWFEPGEALLKFIEEHKDDTYDYNTPRTTKQEARDQAIIKALEELGAYEQSVDMYALCDHMEVSYNTLYYQLYGDKNKNIDGLLSRNPHVVEDREPRPDVIRIMALNNNEEPARYRRRTKFKLTK